MPLNIQQNPSPVHRVALTVMQAGMTITVQPGTFYMHEDLTLAEAAEVTLVADAQYGTRVIGYVARHRETGDVVIAVDEVIEDGEDIPCAWMEYDPYHAIFALTVPPGASSLDDVLILVQHLVAPQQAKVRITPPKEERVERSMRGSDG